MNANRGLNAYKTNNTRNRGNVANPYQLVKLLFENLSDNMARARGAIEQNKPKVKGETIGRCMDIINALRAGLDHEASAEISSNLDQLYIYCNQQLTQASLKNDLEALDAAVTVIQQLKSTWNQLGNTSPENTPDAAA